MTIIAIATAALVFFRAIQQLNVVGRHFVAAAITPFAIATAEVAVVLLVVKTGWSSIPAVGLGGAIGATAAMAAHPLVIRFWRKANGTHHKSRSCRELSRGRSSGGDWLRCALEPDTWADASRHRRGCLQDRAKAARDRNFIRGGHRQMTQILVYAALAIACALLALALIAVVSRANGDGGP